MSGVKLTPPLPRLGLKLNKDKGKVALEFKLKK